MLARRLPAILPPFAFEEALKVSPLKLPGHASGL
jgi:predicted ATPase with chaperone activity